MIKRTLTTTAVMLTLGVTTQSMAQSADVIPLEEWNQQSYDEGWSAERLINLEVRGTEGEAIGEVENILVGPDGNVQSLILEVGGFLDIGDTHLKVDWNQVAVDPSGELGYVTVPVDADNYDQFDISASSGDVESGPRAFRATELIGDYVALDGMNDYGYVNDLVFDKAGALQSVVVNQNSMLGGGYRAYPYYGYDHGFDPGLDRYQLPYEQNEIDALDLFDYDTMGAG